MRIVVRLENVKEVQDQTWIQSISVFMSSSVCQRWLFNICHQHHESAQPVETTQVNTCVKLLDTWKHFFVCDRPDLPVYIILVVNTPVASASDTSCCCWFHLMEHLCVCFQCNKSWWVGCISMHLSINRWSLKQIKTLLTLRTSILTIYKP